MADENKEQQVRELHDKLIKAKAAIFAEYKGLTVDEITQLRRMLHNAGAELKVVKNTLALIASKGTPFEPASKYFFGPTSLAIGYKDSVAPAKIIVSYAKKAKKLNIRGGVIDGILMGAEDIKRLSELPPKEIILAQALACMKSPVTNLVGILQGVIRNFVYTLKAIEKTKTKK